MFVTYAFIAMEMGIISTYSEYLYTYSKSKFSDFIIQYLNLTCLIFSCYSWFLLWFEMLMFLNVIAQCFDGINKLMA